MIASRMGVDVTGAYIGIPLWPSSGLDDYLQESGTIGRSWDTMSHAVLLRLKGCMQSRYVSKAMKEYVKSNDECLHIMLLKPFSSSAQCNDIKHSCYDVCPRSCHCLFGCELEQCLCHMETHIRSLNDTGGKDYIKQWNFKEITTYLHYRLMGYWADLAKNVQHKKFWQVFGLPPLPKIHRFQIVQTKLDWFKCQLQSVTDTQQLIQPKYKLFNYLFWKREA